jgi:PAS fold
MDSGQHPACVHRIDSQQRIVFVNQAWTDFALSNEAPRLIPENVLGTLIWKHIADSETRALYNAILDRVAKHSRTIRFPFRCDAPDRRRYMEMVVSPLPQGIEFTSTLIREEPRPPLPILSSVAPKGDDFIRMCGWCKKVALPGDKWAEVEEAVGVLDLFTDQILPSISHGICPDCFERISLEIGTLKS